MLIGFRVLQGLGGGMLMPLGMTIMTRAAGPHRMGRLMAILGVPMLLGPILGPILGGWLIENASWHWIFLINAADRHRRARLRVVRARRRTAPEPSESFDFLGMLLLSPGLALFLFGVSSCLPEGGDFTAPRVWVSMLVGVLLMLAFVWHSFRPEHPLLDLRLFKNRNLTVSIITMFLFAAAFFGGLLLVPTYFQQVRGESTLAGRAPGRAAGHRRDDHDADRRARWSTRSRSAASCRSAWSLIAIGMFGLTQIEADTSYPLLIGMLFVMGLGMGGTMMPLFTSALKTLTSPRGRPRLDAAQHHPADRQLGRRRSHLGGADQPPQRLSRHPRHREHPGADRTASRRRRRRSSPTPTRAISPS